MKSVFEEASSIAKAIEKGWEKAGRPYKFSVTVFEKPEKNFFGMTKKLAKVGIFFEDQIDSTKRGGTARDSRHRSYRPRRHASRSGYQQSRGQYQATGRQEQGQQKPTTTSEQKKDLT